MGDTWIAEPADSGCVMDLGLSDTSCTSASFSCRMDNHTQSFSLFLILLMVLLFMFVCFLAAFHKDRFQCVSECVDSPYLFGREILVLPRPLTSCCCTNPPQCLLGIWRDLNVNCVFFSGWHSHNSQHFFFYSQNWTKSLLTVCDRTGARLFIGWGCWQFSYVTCTTVIVCCYENDQSVDHFPIVRQKSEKD